MRKRLKHIFLVIGLSGLPVVLGVWLWAYHSLRGDFPWNHENPPSPDNLAWSEISRRSTEKTRKLETKLKVLTWNVQMLPTLYVPFGSGLKKMQHERTPWIISFLKASDCDVICLQEVFDPEILAGLKEGLGEKYPYAINPRYASRWRLVSSGLLFLSRVPVRYVKHVTFSGAGRDGFWTSKGCCLLEGVKDGVPFQVAGTHFPDDKEWIKDDAADLIRNQLLPLCQNNVPLILLGDFNIRKNSVQYQNLLGKLHLADFEINDERPYTSDPFNSWNTGRMIAPELIDHVFLNRNDAEATVSSIEIERPKHEYRNSDCDLSDHYALAAEIVIRSHHGQ